MGTHKEGIQYLIENPVYFAREWVELVRSQGLLKKGKKMIDNWEYEGEMEEHGFACGFGVVKLGSKSYKGTWY